MFSDLRAHAGPRGPHACALRAGRKTVTRQQAMSEHGKPRFHNSGSAEAPASGDRTGPIADRRIDMPVMTRTTRPHGHPARSAQTHILYLYTVL